MRKFILTLFVLAALSILAVLVAGLEGRLRDATEADPFASANHQRQHAGV